MGEWAVTERTPRSARIEGVGTVPGAEKRPGLGRLGRWFRRRERVVLHRRELIAPAVVVACERCGFNFTVTTIDLGLGQTAILWECACGSRYHVPGGKDSFNLVRP